MDQVNSRELPALKMMHDVFGPVSFTAGDVAKYLKHCPGLSALQCYVGETLWCLQSCASSLLPCPPFRKSCDGKVLVVDPGRSYISASETLGIPAQPNKNIWTNEHEGLMICCCLCCTC